MQVEAAAALAPVLARNAIVVDGPLEAEVVTRLAAGGERRTTLADLARPFPGRADLSRPDTVAVAGRAAPTSLLPGPSGPLSAPVPVTVEDASRVLQQTLAARSLAAPLASSYRAVAALAPPAAPVVPPGVWAELVAAGWTTGSGAGTGTGTGGGGGVAAAAITLHPPAGAGAGSHGPWPPVCAHWPRRPGPSHRTGWHR